MRGRIQSLAIVSMITVSMITVSMIMVSPTAAADSVAILSQSQVGFATVEEARQILTTRDRFVREMSGVDRQLRLGSIKPISEAAFLHFVRQQALPWEEPEVRRLTNTLNQIRPLLKSLKPLWPKRILLIKTTGLEEANAAHCRGTAIVLPRSDLQRETKSLKRLLLHELFHVLSAHSPDIRKDLYEIVGFEKCSRISLPLELQSRKLTNPDAPAIDCVITLDNDGQQRTATPVLLSRQAKYESLKNRTLFSELQFRLLVVERDGADWRAKLTDGTPQLLVPQNEPSFRSQIGRNTRYIIHPEEILADNFVQLVLADRELPDPWIVQRMGNKLRK